MGMEGTMVWWMVTAPAWSQAYEARPCRADAQLATELAAGQVEGIASLGPWPGMSASSSLLPPPASAKPDLVAAQRMADESEGMMQPDGDDGLALIAADLLSCAYGPPRLLDGDPTTAWCEGAKGNGVGEVVLVELPTGGPLKIRNGYAKDADRFAQNGRVRKVEVTVLGQGWTPPVQGNAAADLPVLGRHEVELTDTDGWQTLPLPRWAPPTAWAPRNPSWAGKPADQRPTYITLRILSVYPGTKWEDTCISEIALAK